MFRNRKGQSTLEYAVIITVVIAALLAMQHYMRRGVSGKLRESADRIGEQYSAGNMTSKVTTQQESDSISRETFGLAADHSTRAQGVSRYEVQKTAVTRHTNAASEADKEQVTKGFEQETLF